MPRTGRERSWCARLPSHTAVCSGILLLILAIPFSSLALPFEPMPPAPAFSHAASSEEAVWDPATGETEPAGGSGAAWWRALYGGMSPTVREWGQRLAQFEQSMLEHGRKLLRLAKGDGVAHFAFGWAAGLPFFASVMPTVEVVFAGDKAPVGSQVTSGVNVMSGVYSSVVYLRMLRPKKVPNAAEPKPSDAAEVRPESWGRQVWSKAKEWPGISHFRRSAPIRVAKEGLSAVGRTSTWKWIDKHFLKNRRVAGGLSIAGVSFSTEHPIHGTPFAIVNVPQVGALMGGFKLGDDERLRLFGAVVAVLAPLSPSSPLVAFETSRSFSVAPVLKFGRAVEQRTRGMRTRVKTCSGVAWEGARQWGRQVSAACRGRLPAQSRVLNPAGGRLRLVPN